MRLSVLQMPLSSCKCPFRHASAPLGFAYDPFVMQVPLSVPWFWPKSNKKLERTSSPRCPFCFLIWPKSNQTRTEFFASMPLTFVSFPLTPKHENMRPQRPLKRTYAKTYEHTPSILCYSSFLTLLRSLTDNPHHHIGPVLRSLTDYSHRQIHSVLLAYPFLTLSFLMRWRVGDNIMRFVGSSFHPSCCSPAACLCPRLGR
jgi:hypothetical protein